MHYLSKLLLLTLFYSGPSLMCFNSHADEKIAACDSLQSVAWLLGDWRGGSGDNILLESWVEISPKTFEGLGETRSKAGNMLQSHEMLRLLDMDGEIFYLAKVGHNALPVAFKLSQCSDMNAVFDNPDHDFPQKLVYRLAGKDRLSVTVSDGNDKGFTIYFRRRFMSQ